MRTLHFRKLATTLVTLFISSQYHCSISSFAIITFLTFSSTFGRYVRIVEGRHIEFENDSWIGGWELELHFLYNSKALQQGFRAGESLVYVTPQTPSFF